MYQVLIVKLLQIKQKISLLKNELKKLKTFDLSFFIGKCNFEENSTQNCLVFHPLKKYFKITANKKYISLWQSKRLSDETIKPPAASDNSLTPLIDYLGNKIGIKFTGSCLKEPNIS